ncbi:hypothetical protein [Sphingosinicella sp. BN140058]|uniref:hypothetical protein n=1 Tax=Sphingosinicella sp. BN140058 TaxID=1892855 RepID=UPI001012AC6E|nr:hypothetical protein [Sphingosinicella sp. BN140058]QAY80293.1 hypothetical protein ETR14_26995 [Sphingosinicella sp. BN140058]
MKHSPLTRMSDDRLRLLFDRMDRADDVSGQEAAFRLAHQALSAAGVSWASLLEARLTANGAAAAVGVGQDFMSVFDGLFEGLQRASPERTPASPFAAAATPTPKRTEHLTGASIPSEIWGAIKVEDRRSVRNGTMLIVDVRNSFGTFGPLAIFGARDIEKIDAHPEAAFAGRVRQPTNPRHQPTLYALRHA